MRQPVKQAALTVALTAPLVVTALFSTPFSASTRAQPANAGGLVGPRAPILADANGNGPSLGDAPVTPTQGSATTLQLSPLFSCGTQQNNTVTLSGTDGSGKYRTASRTNNGRDQVLNVTNASNGQAMGFSGTETLGSSVRAQGTGTVVDANGDGSVDGVSISMTNGSMMVSLVFTPDSNYVSIPVGQAVLLGAKQGDCGPPFSQIWVPLADTNGDGRGDSIVLDLDGDGIPDPQYYRSPRLGAIGVPTTNNLGLAFLTLLLGGTGVWYLGRRRFGDLGQA
jgi:hypothetical protein